MKIANLRPQEKRIIALLAQGLNNDAIAAELCISASTVKNHIQNIYVSLGVSYVQGRNSRVLATIRYLEECGGKS